MAAPKGNRFWRVRERHGRKPLFTNSESLLAACIDYFDWVETNPLKEEKVFSWQGNVIRTEVGKMRAMTIIGMCMHLGIDVTTWRDYRKKDDFSPVIARVEQIIHEQKFTGAAAGMFNANIISRDLGLTDKKEVKANITDCSYGERKMCLQRLISSYR